MQDNGIVVTGLGCVSSFGNSLQENWESIFSGQTSIRRTKNIELDKIYCDVSSQLESFDYDEWKHNVPNTSRFILVGLCAVEQALIDAGLITKDNLYVDESRNNVGVVLGSGVGGLEDIYETSKRMLEGKHVSAYFITKSLINLFPGQVGIRHKLTGVNQSQVTACGTGAFAVEDGARMIREGVCDVAIVGASETAVCKIGLAGFCAIKALSSNNIDAEKSSRPFDKKRSGFVMGEGSGVLIIESERHALERNAKIYCRYIGAGISNDATSITAPNAHGEGATKAMANVIDRYSVKAEEIDYINCHATSTNLGDKAEIIAIKSIFSKYWDNLMISSIKGATGHMLGAAGAFEAVMSVLSLYNQKVLPTINCTEPDDECYYKDKLIDLVLDKGKEAELNYVMSNSFGFGGHNISLLFKKY